MVSIICCTMRSSYMDNIFNNYERQEFGKKEMIIILNSDDMDIGLWETKARRYANVSVYQVSEKHKLGRCLNEGIAKAKYDIIAKFDDDDYYAPHYLLEAVDQLKKSDASIIGKHTTYVYFEQIEALMLYREGREHKYRNKVKGGTLVFKRSVWDHVKFSERKEFGSDTSFLNRCKRKGYLIYSVSKYNYVCIRRADINSHTQKISMEALLAKCILISHTHNFVPFITKNMTS